MRLLHQSPARRVWLAAALATASLPARAQAPDYPARPVLDAFRQACSQVSDLAATARAAEAGGWRRVEKPACTAIGPLVTFALKAGDDMAKSSGIKLSGMTVLTRDVAGETLFIVLSGVETGGTVSNGCRLFDVGETRRLSVEAASTWLGRKPTEVLTRVEIERATWSPGFAPGLDSFEVYFIPKDSAAVKLTQVSGISLKSDYVGSAAKPK